MVKISYSDEVEKAIRLWEEGNGDYADDLEPYDFDIDIEEDIL